MEEYPSLVEGTGLENREVVRAAQGFESLFLRHLNLLFIAGWSSSVARWAHNPEVVGSNPSPATMVPWCSGYHVCLSRKRSRVQLPSEPPFNGSIAQLVEHRTENPGVGGSIPLGATIYFLLGTLSMRS